MPEILSLSQIDDKECFDGGHHKNVRMSNRSDRVFKEYEKNIYYKHIPPESMARFLKGEFYLTKIMCLLLPDGVAKMHFAGVISDIEKNTTRNFSVNEYIYEKKSSIVRGFYDKLDNLRGELDKIGVKYDSEDEEFKLDERDGKVKYVDSFDPWDLDSIWRFPDLPYYHIVNKVYTGTVKPFFDGDALRIIIQERLSLQDQEKALRYLRRLEELVVEEQRAVDLVK